MPDEQSQPQPTPPPAQVTPPPQTAAWAQTPQGYYAQQPQPQNDAIQTLIPTQNPPSLVSYYCGVFSLIVCLAPILSTIAIVFGIIALKKVKATPGLKGSGHAWTGIILGSITWLIFLAGVVLIFLSGQHNAS